VIELVGGLPKNVVGISVKGKLTIQDCRAVLVPAMKRSLKYHDKIRLYYELDSRFPGAAWDDLDLGLEDFSRCERVAIVTDIGWVRLTVKAVRFLIPSEIRVFASVQAEEGLAWITAPAVADATAEASAPAQVRATRPRRRIRRSSGAPAAARRARRPQPKRLTALLNSVERAALS
jgi:SpoIIAA-like